MQGTSTGWIYVDLGAPCDIDEVRLNWETAYAVNYQIQVSDDAVNWVAIEAISGNQSKGPVDFSGLSAVGRYARIYCTQTSAGSDNYSLYDFQVYGTPAALSPLQTGGSLAALASTPQASGLAMTAAPPAALASPPTGPSAGATTPRHAAPPGPSHSHHAFRPRSPRDPTNHPRPTSLSSIRSHYSLTRMTGVASQSG
jgi:hypothetical protein